jgi:hypothetical protein
VKVSAAAAAGAHASEADARGSQDALLSLMQQNCVASWQEQPQEVRARWLLERKHACLLSAHPAGRARAAAASVRGDAGPHPAAAAPPAVRACRGSAKLLSLTDVSVPVRFLLHARDTLGTDAEALLEGEPHVHAALGCPKLLTPLCAGLLEHGRLQLSQLLQRAAVRTRTQPAKGSDV